jgi:hypothetical protein
MRKEQSLSAKVKAIGAASAMKQCAVWAAG